MEREKEKVVKASEERDSLLPVRECLEKEAADSKASLLPAKDEPEGVANLSTRANLVAQIQVLELDYMDALTEGFETAIVQLSVLNMGLNTEGARVLSHVVDGKVVPPPDYPELEIKVGTSQRD